ncbi:hypothetical protein Pth03_10260 [Planotetraspora thailandica]|uniref:Uncharacterized protein n=1 Tax=Planotetraspora thailandica TaxID=487172 RepID=A0A8J3UWE1_9ACTN|nr:hypothetical protein [Planotetraspora thailandica]GII52637.1 hypothetical protein Pth03_10260 [Planotetraspora thailandica]
MRSAAAGSAAFLFWLCLQGERPGFVLEDRAGWERGVGDRSQPQEAPEIPARIPIPRTTTIQTGAPSGRFG